MITLPSELTPVTDYLQKQGCFPVIVGGYLRDTLLDVESKDIDIEVYVVKDIETLQHMLEPFGSVNLVGKSFGVLKLSLAGYHFDFSLPRKESKTSTGHRGFNISLSGQMDFITAAQRRDFTINAMGYVINSSLLLDPYGGQRDLEAQTLRCVDPETFVEDPLRILRAIQMAGRFELQCDEQLLRLCSDMVDRGVLKELPKERLFEEIKKLLLKASRPSIGLTLMREMHILDFLPELRALVDVPQDPDIHPEGDVWIHTLMAVDAMASLRTGEDKRDLTLMLAVLCHDLGKPSTTEKIDGQWSAPAHEEAGVKITQTFLTRITDEKRLINDVLALVRFHPRPLRFYKDSSDDSHLRRLAVKVSLEDLLLIAKADYLGRKTEEAAAKSYPAGDWFEQRAAALDVLHTPPKPLIQGRDLVAAKIAPSPHFKVILDRAFDAQLDGEFSTYDEAKMWLSTYLSSVDFGKS